MAHLAERDSTVKHRFFKLQLARRTIQFAVLVLTLAIPAVARYTNYLAARELDRNLERWDATLQGEVMVALDHFFRFLPDGEKERNGEMVRNRTQVLGYAQQVRGAPWSAQFAALSLTDPLAGLESIIASKRLAGVLLVSLLIPVAATLLLGRVFCSWICPMGLLLEGADKLRRLLHFLRLKPRDIHCSRALKYILLGLGLVMTAFLALPVLGYIYPPAIISRELHDLVAGIFDRAEAGRFGFWAGGLTWMSLILLGIVLLELTISRRWWCRYICPGGALYSLLGWARPVRVKRSSASCIQCGTCAAVCPMGLVPMRDLIGHECDNCGLCISHCDPGALDYALGRRAENSSPSSDPGTKSAVQEQSVKIAKPTVAALFFLLLFTSPAVAHHILGIPHYAYDEQYPQIPVLTYRVEAGRYEVKMMGYPGRLQPGEQCVLHVYVRRQDSGIPFDGEVRLTVMQDRLLGSDPIVYGPTEARLEEALYKFYPRFEDEANYIARLEFEVEGEPWIIDLPMVAGEPGSPWKVLGGAIIGVALFLIVIRALRIKRQRRRAPTRSPLLSRQGSFEGELPSS